MRSLMLAIIVCGLGADVQAQSPLPAVEEAEEAALSAKKATPSKERFERVAEGIRDNQQNLIWAKSDNGSAINWRDARWYCASRGAGWSLPNSAALQSLYDPSGEYARTRTYRGTAYTIKPATPLIDISSCCFWSNERRSNKINGSSEALVVNLNAGYENAARVRFARHGRALCVRRP